VTFINCRTKRHIQNLTTFHGWLDPTIIYRDPVETYLALPTTADGWTKIADESEKHANFPHCIGAVDGKHVRLFQPTDSGSLYRVIINDYDCPIAVGVVDVVECAASLIT
jgi:hypothetical protein